MENKIVPFAMFMGLDFKLYLQEALKEIARLNHNKDTALYGLTKFSDMSAEEFSSRMLMKKGMSDTGCDEYYKECDRSYTKKSHVFHINTLPTKFDW